MAHIVTERCVDCRYTDCCAVCPVECFYEVKSPAMLVIDPVTCIDCAMCIPECPIYAIYPAAEVPEPYKEWIPKNADLFKKGTHITAKTQALPTAIPLDAIHAREKSRGWSIKDPSAVASEAAGGAAAAAKPAAEAVPPPPLPGEAPKEEGRARRAPRFAERPTLRVRRGGRVRVGWRSGVVQEIRKAKAADMVDMRIFFDGEDKPVWYLYSTLQSLRERGEFEVLDPGPMPGLLELLAGGDLRF
jgi:ferredoxin